MNAEWQKASIDYAMQNVATLTKAEAFIEALKRERVREGCT
jgi:hypothetical protein